MIVVSLGRGNQQRFSLLYTCRLTVFLGMVGKYLFFYFYATVVLYYKNATPSRAVEASRDLGDESARVLHVSPSCES